MMLVSKTYSIFMRQKLIYNTWWLPSSLLEILMKGLKNLWLWCTTLGGIQFQVLQRLLDLLSRLQDRIYEIISTKSYKCTSIKIALFNFLNELIFSILSPTGFKEKFCIADMIKLLLSKVFNESRFSIGAFKHEIILL